MTVMLNRRIVLKNIYYDFDKADLRAESVKELEKVISFMRVNPDLKIELGSHTDSRGNDDYNMRLSERRAKSVVDYIISRGISPERIVSKGYGETRLVNDCGNGVKCTEEEHQQNRRTEILILEK
jgi:outer membrane protein OmpA-like peptidoglycan-associated protein